MTEALIQEGITGKDLENVMGAFGKETNQSATSSRLRSACRGEARGLRWVRRSGPRGSLTQSFVLCALHAGLNALRVIGQALVPGRGKQTLAELADKREKEAAAAAAAARAAAAAAAAKAAAESAAAAGSVGGEKK